MPIHKPFQRIEARLQYLIETYIQRLIPTSKLSSLLAQNLVETMATHLRRKGDQYIAPNFYTIRLSPSLATDLRGDPSLLDALSASIEEAGGEAGLSFPSKPQISVIEDQDLDPGEIVTSARIHLGPLNETKAMSPSSQQETSPIPDSAFLIINGNQIFPLTQAIINIGRRGDNTLVLDDPSVSRLHAQLRAIDNHYTLFDLGSTSGTSVNGQRVVRSLLYPGDVISLGSTQLVYGQDPPRPLDEAHGYTKPLPVDQKKTITRRKADESSQNSQ